MNEIISNMASDLDEIAESIGKIAALMIVASKGLAKAANILQEPEGGEEKRYRYEARFFMSEPIDVYAKDRFEAFKKAKKKPPCWRTTITSITTSRSRRLPITT